MSDRICVVGDCARPFYARGWCKMHYRREWAAGRHTARPRELVEIGASLDERLRHHGWVVTASGCWEFGGSKDDNGYGQLAVGGSYPMKASRAAHLAWIGPIPAGLDVCHSCDNPPCMNPDHLFAGTRLINVNDMRDKGRMSSGERQPQHKLTDAQVIEIRATYAAGGVPQHALAADYGVCQQLISSIVRGQKRSLAVADALGEMFGATRPVKSD